MSDELSRDAEIERLQTKLIYLEELYSHQQRWIQVLDESVIELRREIERAHARNEILLTRLDTAMALLESGGRPNEKPPHY